MDHAASSTPMLRQYAEVKSRHKDCILFFRLGDFYEMFYEDAREASRLLELVLTARGSDDKGKVPMCGIPYHSAENYIARLVRAGRKVAICEQVEDPAAVTKGIVRREVVRIISAGTFLDDGAEARFLLALCPGPKAFGLAFTDTATGTLQANEFFSEHQVLEVLSRIPLNECVYPEEKEAEVRKLLAHPMLRLKGVTLTAFRGWSFDPQRGRKILLEHFAVQSLRGFGIEPLVQAQAAAGALVEYLRDMNKTPVKHLDRIALYNDSSYVYISPAAHYGLELDSLLKTLDRTITPMGRRLFRSWLYHPLKAVALIEQRLDAVTHLLQDPRLSAELGGVLLKDMPDVEKSLSRVSCSCAQPRDFLVIRNALARAPGFAAALERAPVSEGTANELFIVNDIPGLRAKLVAAIDPDMPLAKNEGKVIRAGFNAQLDELKSLQDNGLEWLQDYQAREVRRSGINSLKVGFNRIFGYYIEITNANLKAVPADYQRRQTLVNGERFITPELKDHEVKILSAQEKVLQLEAEILGELARDIVAATHDVHRFCREVAVVDVLASLARGAAQPGYTRPRLTDGTELVITAGRHPVVEGLVDGGFIPNDTRLGDDTRLVILTGPNMAGKSTYIRQNALLVVMAQMGGYVPAAAARIGVVDKIFTRIGAHDEIAKGQSTFMVEMTEAADIVNNLTPRSLIILDEIGRGTSTYDGLALAWALVEHLHAKKARVFFATHFHELTRLSEQLSGVKNYNVLVREWEDQVIFLHQIVPGAADDSYGIYVAKLAGMPGRVVTRANVILAELEQGRAGVGVACGESQPDLFKAAPADPGLEALRVDLAAVDIENLTPLQALQKLNELKRKYA
ncbi:MAG: DNA mismatch repair protein MutS [Candidatus Omnitrophica bacterium]|nr:DNA mismatch repair protein MutS [Candidatus Omnitrophota bacterium]